MAHTHTWRHQTDIITQLKPIKLTQLLPRIMVPVLMADSLLLALVWINAGYTVQQPLGSCQDVYLLSLSPEKMPSSISNGQP